MLNVLQSTNLVFEKITEIKISEEKIAELIEKVKESDLKTPEINYIKYPWKLEELIQIIFLFNILNFCYWAKKGELKWTVEINGGKLDGAIALFRCLEEEVKRDLNILEGKTLKKITSEKLAQILKGNVEIPLFHDRLKCLNEAGIVLEEKFNGSFLNIYRQANNDALKLVKIIVDNFPSFDDISLYQNQTLAFYKRAQLNSKMISDALATSGQKPLDNLDKLTAFADYKVPQILRKLGILEYSPTLAQKIDNYEIIEPNSKEEIEIRVATIWAVEKIKEKLMSKFPFVTSSHVDSMLWNFSQTKTVDEKPYHRTLTIVY